MTRLPDILLALCWLSPAAQAFALTGRSASQPYAPESATCPAQPLSRLADNSISQAEQTYINARTPQADQALLSWLEKTLSSWPKQKRSSGWGNWGGWTSPPWGPHWYPGPDNSLPRLALALSGGGPKAGLTSAGVVQGLDGRDSSTGVSGLLQAMSYISALSGGTLTLAPVAVNNFATVSSLRTSLWNTNYQNPFTVGVNYASNITADIDAKTAAGYPATLVDLYGRVEAYDFLSTNDGGAGITWSSVLDQSEFQSAAAPLPILTFTDTNVLTGACYPTSTGAIWEASPIEFGSWDPTVGAFTQTKYLGTNATNGKPTGSDSCTIEFDNAGFLVGISTNIITTGVACSEPFNNSNADLSGLANVLVSVFHTANVYYSEYGIVPNPFYGLSGAGNISSRQDLFMLDGGDSGQGIPIFPFLQPARDIDVILAVDENSSGTQNITDGSSIYDTYVAAQRLGLDNMPPVPDVDAQAAMNFSLSGHFLGCYDPKLTTVIYLPNSLETQFPSSDFFFTPEQIDLVITEGTDIVTQSNSTEWPKCVACAIMHKHAAFLFDECSECLEKYCYVP